MEEKTNSQYALDIICGTLERTIRRLWQVIIALVLVIALMAGLFIWYLPSTRRMGQALTSSEKGTVHTSMGQRYRTTRVSRTLKNKSRAKGVAVRKPRKRK